jgi:hypothetical protein
MRRCDEGRDAAEQGGIGDRGAAMTVARSQCFNGFRKMTFASRVVSAQPTEVPPRSCPRLSRASTSYVGGQRVANPAGVAHVSGQ